MIHEQEEANIKLTPEEIGRLEGFKRILLNLESEISIARKHIRVLKDENEKAIKEKMYQDEILATVVPQVEAKKAQATQLDEEILAKTANLNTLMNAIRSRTEEQEEKSIKLKEWEERNLSKEQILVSWESSLSAKAEFLELEKKEFNAKVAKLQEVTSTI